MKVRRLEWAIAAVEAAAADHRKNLFVFQQTFGAKQLQLKDSAGRAGRWLMEDLRSRLVTSPTDASIRTKAS